MMRQETGNRGRLVDVAPLVREMMAQYGLTREALAEQLDVTGVTVFYWLKGGRATRLYAERVQAVAKRLAANRAGRKKPVLKNS